MQASHHTIAAHRLVILAEVNTVSQDWGNLLFKLPLAEALEEVATSVTEEAWLNNENAFYFCFDYIHDSNLSSYIRFFRKPTLNGLYTPFGSPVPGGQKPSLPLKKEFFLPLRLSCKESSTFSPSPSSSGSGDVTALRCSEPLRSKVGGPSKVYAILCGMGPLGAIGACIEELHLSVLPY